MNDTAAIIRVILVFLLVIPGLRIHAAPVETLEEAVITGFIRGDCQALADSLPSMLAEHPLDPVSVIHYNAFFRMAEISGPGAIERTAVAVKEKLRATPGEDAASCLIRFNCGLERMLYRTKGAAGAQITNELKPVRKWTIFGPYLRYGAADIDFRFQPELMASVRDITPQKKITIAEIDGWLDPGKYINAGQGVIYASASFRIPKLARIRLYSGGSYKVFINGRLAARNLYRDRRAMRMIQVRNERDITVTVKMIGPLFEKMRMLVTDEHNAIIEPEVRTGSLFVDECDITEVLDYPYDRLVAETKKNPEAGYRHLGQFFDDLESGEAAGYYKKSAAQHRGRYVLLLQAGSLLDRNSEDRGSAGYNQGLAIIDDLIKQNIVPAWRKKIEHWLRTGEVERASDELKRLISAGPGNPYLLADYLASLDALDYEKEFEETLGRAKKEFPAAIPVIEAETAYHGKRDRDKFITSSRELIRLDCSAQRVRPLLREYIIRGDYRPAQNLIQAYNFNFDFNAELVEMLIKMGDLTAARRLVLNLLVAHEMTYLYNALAQIDILQGEDPSMYLQKLILMQPSLFSMADYAKYLETGALENPFKQFLDHGERMDDSLLQRDPGTSPSTLLYRGRFFLLQKEGSSRVYCEDIVYVRNEEGVQRWSEVRIPYQGRLRPVHVRVYDGTGNKTDSYTIQKSGAHRLLGIRSLEKNSFIHLSYLVDDPVPTPAGSGIFSLPLEYLHHYNEPVQRVSIKVIAPDKMRVHFVFKDKVIVKKSSVDGLQFHEAVIENIPAVKEEPLSGDQNLLHYYSFSTFDGFADFSTWYQGLQKRNESNRALPASRFRNDTLEKTISAVYDFTAREIELKPNVLFFPGSAENTLYNKSGSPEDKTILAQSLLKRLGISSYLAFARDRLLPGAGTCLYPEYFTNMLLCVPLDEKNAMWLDFSSPHYRCGVTTPALAGTDALVLLHDSFIRRKVTSLDPR